MQRSFSSAIPALITSALVALASACGGGSDSITLSATATTTEVVAGQDILVDITSDGLELVDPAVTSTAASGQGHYHVYLDDADGADYLWMGTEAQASVPIPLDTTPGAHTLRVQVAGNDHVVDTEIPAATIAITVLEVLLPTVTATADLTTVPNGGTVTLTIAVTNFTLSAGSIGGANVPGEGHYHAAIVGTGAYEVSATPTIPIVVDVDTPGDYVINVSLRNNDHGPVLPAVEANVTVTVIPAT